MKIQDIKKEIEKHTGISVDERSRKKEIIFVRFMYYYLSMKYGTGYVDDTIISKTVPFDRCSVIHGIKTFPSLINYNLENYNTFIEIENIIAKDSKSIVEKINKIGYEEIRLCRIINNLRAKNINLKAELNKHV